MKRFFSLLLTAVTLIICCCGCGGETPAAGPSASKAPGLTGNGKTRELSLLYCKADSLNPYTCSTKYNRELCDLLYDPLIKLDAGYNVQKCLADDIGITANDVTVALKSASFSDGSAVGVKDVIYSFNLAKKSDSYNSVFGSVSCSEGNDGRIVFKLKSPDGNFCNFLDFPIIKADSDSRKSDDNLSLPPIGCGRYIYSESDGVLKANPSYHNGRVAVPAIHLVDTPDKTAASHQLEVGAVDYYYTDLSDGEMPKLNGTSRNIVLNKLVYIGVNQKDSRLAVTGVRQALSAALNRGKIVESSFHSDAVAAGSPYNPMWDAAKDLQYIEESGNKDIAVANLEEAGYNKKSSTGIRYGAGGAALSFSLLCPDSDPERVAAADVIKSQLKESGIGIKVEKVGFNEFSERLKSGNFQLFLAEIQIRRNMDISSFALEGGAAAYGVIDGEVGADPETSDPRSSTASGNVSSESATAGGSSASASESTNGSLPQTGENARVKLSETVAQYKKLEASVFDVIAAFNTAMPVVPLCFKCGVCVYASDIKTAPYPTASDYFYNIENTVFK